MTDPAAYPRRILLAVTGLSPQIVTETLYALAVKGSPAWAPTEIRLITTRQGAEKAQRTLLSDDPGWFRRLCADYRLPGIAFGAKDIRIIAGPDGKPLDDILDERDNAAVADFITEEVRALTADPNASLHVSIAGGRKTMGLYVGYALSLFGREQDRLSHVLAPSLELTPELFYPPPSVKDAHVHLGDIPFVRLRYGLPERRLFEGRARFSEIVAEAQKALPPVALHLDPDTLTVTAGGQRISLAPAQFAFYWMTAERCRAGCGGAHWTDPGITEELLEFYSRLVDPDSRVYANVEQAYRQKSGKADFKFLFDPTKTLVNRALRLALGQRVAAPYLIDRCEPIAGTRFHRFGMGLPPEAITIAASLRARQIRAAGSK
jgi:CRISPR-associated protein (TIGR02584 family)